MITPEIFLSFLKKNETMVFKKKRLVRNEIDIALKLNQYFDERASLFITREKLTYLQDVVIRVLFYLMNNK